MGPDDLAQLAGLDLALDELAAGRDAPAERAGGEAAALATLAAELREAVPDPLPGAAGAAGRRSWPPADRARWRRRSLPVRLVAVAAALVVLVALPAAARQARPGEALWPVRELGQAARDRLADDPVHRAHPAQHRGHLHPGREGRRRGGREDMADQAEERIEAALEALEGVAGPSAAAERARASLLLLQVEALEHQKDADDRSGSGSGPGPGPPGARTPPAPGAAAVRRATTVPAAAAAPGPAGRRSSGSGSGSSGSSGRRPAMTEPGAATEGRRLGGRYRVEALLATGGMGEVWAARDLLLNRAVAVKVLGGALAGDGRAAERLRREARAAAGWSISIARVLDLGEQDGALPGHGAAGGEPGRADRPRRCDGGAGGGPGRGRGRGRPGGRPPGRGGPPRRQAGQRVPDLRRRGQGARLRHRLRRRGGRPHHRRDARHQPTWPPSASSATPPPRPPTSTPSGSSCTSCWPAAALRRLRHRAGHDPRARPPRPPRPGRPSAPPFLVAACEQAMAKDPSARPRQPPPSPSSSAPSARSQPPRHPPPLPAAGGLERANPPVAGRRSRSRRRGLLVALVAGAVLAALPVLGGGLLRGPGNSSRRRSSSRSPAA